MNGDTLVQAINDFGFPVIAAAAATFTGDNCNTVRQHFYITTEK